MARTKRQIPTEPAEIPTDIKPQRAIKPISVTLDDLKGQIPALLTAVELSDPELPSFAQKIMAQNAVILPVPEGFKNVSRHVEAGIRVNKSLDKRVAGIQFAEDRLPSRAEKDVLEALGQPESQKFEYKPASRQWERQASEAYGANIIEATRIAADMAREREGRGR